MKGKEPIICICLNSKKKSPYPKNIVDPANHMCFSKVIGVFGSKTSKGMFIYYVKQGIHPLYHFATAGGGNESAK